MLDTDLIVQQLRRRGHSVEGFMHVPANAGEWEFVVDGNMLNLEQVRALMELDDLRSAQSTATTIH